MPGAPNAQAGFMSPANPGRMAAATSNYISGISGHQLRNAPCWHLAGSSRTAACALGGPAGLQRYSLHNHTAHAIPGPTRKVNVHVKQKPGLTYPRPADKVLIHEKTIRPPHFNHQPPADMLHGNIQCRGCGGRGCGACR